MQKTVSLYLKSEIIQNGLLAAIVGVVFFVIATTLGAYVRIPIKGSPVPITLQTFFVLLSGAVLGKRLGLLSQLTYLSLGIFGMPVFQGYSFGILHLVGPTGGYLIGFLGASFVVGSIMDKVSLSRYWTVLAFLAGNFIIYLFGATWLAYVYRMSISHAIAIGILPFIPGDLIKIALASLVYMRTSKRVRQIFTL